VPYPDESPADRVRRLAPNTRDFEDGNFVGWLSDLILATNLSLEALGDAFGIGHKPIYGFSTNPPLPLTFEMQARIAQAIDVPVAEIIRLSPKVDHPGRAYGPTTRANDASMRFQITLSTLLDEGKVGPDGIPTETAIVKRSRQLFEFGEYTGDARVEPRRVSPKVAKRKLAEYRAFVETVRLRQQRGQTLK
jgi:hypothetical protein